MFPFPSHFSSPICLGFNVFLLWYRNLTLEHTLEEKILIMRSANHLFFLVVVVLGFVQVSLSISLQGLECDLLNCGEGKCIETNSTLFGVDCECNAGWKKPHLGDLTLLPSCIIPNCTVNFKCGSGSPSPTPAPPPPSAATHFDLFDICNYIWCGDGTCQMNGTGYSCDCNAGSGNLFNSSNLACFKPCYLGGDCDGLNISIASSSPPPPPPSPPTDSAPPRPGLVTLYAVAAGGSALLLMLLG